MEIWRRLCGMSLSATPCPLPTPLQHVLCPYSPFKWAASLTHCPLASGWVYPMASSSSDHWEIESEAGYYFPAPSMKVRYSSHGLLCSPPPPPRPLPSFGLEVARPSSSNHFWQWPPVGSHSSCQHLWKYPFIMGVLPSNYQIWAWHLPPVGPLLMPK